MSRIIIIGEGPTEQSFCNDVLQPHFNAKGTYLQNPTIKKSGGGIVSWEVLKRQINIHLRQDTTATITLLIDYYGIKARHEFPMWVDSQDIVNKSERMTILERAMLDEIDEAYKHRFIPYIQLHEFEGLLFSDRLVFDENFEENEFDDYDYLDETFNTYENPEEINDGNETAPSKRLCRIISSYNKIAFGSLIAQEIGLEKIRQKCPRFNDWVSTLEKV